VENRLTDGKRKDGRVGEVWGMMACDDQSYFRHSKALWDLRKTAQPLKTPETDLYELQKHTRRTIKEIQPLLLSGPLLL